MLPCPDLDQLRSYFLGRMTDVEAETLETHLETCSSCQQMMATLDNEQDSLVGKLCRAVEREEFLNDMPHLEAVSAIRRFPNVPAAPSGTSAAMAEQGIGTDDAKVVDTAVRTSGSIAHYELVRRIGAGGMGTVYEAIHKRLHRVVALKVLTTRRLADAESIARFEREMATLGKLRNPHVVAATDAGEADGTHYLVMEFVEGVTVAELLRRKSPLPIADACELIRQAASGLQYIHENDLVHRDIKPSNLMVTPHGQVKILDLGLAMFASRSEFPLELTKTNQIMGTLDYMAPEQCHDSRAVDIRADIYSLGATFYKLVTGESVLGKCAFDTPIQKLTAIATGDIAPVSTHRSDVPEPVARTIERMLAKNAADRFSTPAEVVEALSPFCAGHDLSGVLEEFNTPPRAEADLDTATPPSESTPVMKPITIDVKPTPRIGQSRNARTTVWLAACVLAVLVLAVLVLAATIFIMRSAKVEFVVEISDPQILAQARDGELIVTDQAKNRQFKIRPGENRLPAGRYHSADERLLFEVSDERGLNVIAEEFSLKRGRADAVRVIARVPAAQTARQDRSPPKAKEGTDSVPENAVGEDAAPLLGHIGLTALDEDTERVLGFPNPIALRFESSQPTVRIDPKAAGSKPLRISRLVFVREDLVKSGRKTSAGQDIHEQRTVKMWQPIRSEPTPKNTVASTRILGVHADGTLHLRPDRPLDDGVYCLHTDDLDGRSQPTFTVPFVIRGWGLAEVTESNVAVTKNSATLSLTVANPGKGDLNDASIRVTVQRQVGSNAVFETSQEMWPDETIGPGTTAKIPLHWDVSKWKAGTYYFYGYVTSRHFRSSTNAYCKFESKLFEIP